MVVDTSAIVAILEGEPEAAPFLEQIVDASSARMALVSFVEASMVMRGRRPDGVQDLDDLIAVLRIELTDLDLAQARLAREAFARYGKGNHPAGLNLGDLFAYAPAKHLKEPLLFKGNDFSRTDITPAC